MLDYVNCRDIMKEELLFQGLSCSNHHLYITEVFGIEPIATRRFCLQKLIEILIVNGIRASLSVQVCVELFHPGF